MASNSLRRYLGIALSLLAIFAIIYFFSDIVTWVVLAWILSMLGLPLVHLLGKLKIRNWQLSNSIRAVIVLVLFYTLAGFLISCFVPVILEQGRNLSTVNYAAVIKGLEEPLSHLNERLEKWGVIEEEPIVDSIQVESEPIIEPDSADIDYKLDLDNRTAIKTTTIHIDSIIRSRGDTVTQTHIQLLIQVESPKPKIQKEKTGFKDPTAAVQPTDTPIEKAKKELFSYLSPSAIITGTFSTLVGWFGNLLILITSVSFIAFFFLRDDQLFGDLIKGAVPNAYSDKVDQTLHQIRVMLTRYFGGILLQITIVTLYMWLMLSLFGVPNAFLIAFFAAFINVVPYLGPIIGGLFGLLVTICSSLDVDFYLITMPLLFKVVLIFASMQAIDNFLLQPIIFSKSVLAHPLEIFIAIIVGAKLGGIVGMVVAIPLYTIVRVIASVFLSQFKIVQSLTQQLSNQAGSNGGEEDNPNEVHP